MRRKIGLVLGTYIRRPLVRLILLLATMLAFGLYGNGLILSGKTDLTGPSVQLSGNLAFLNSDDWNEYFVDHRPESLDSLQLVDSGLAAFPDLSSLTRLSTLKLTSNDFTADKLASVNSIPGLQQLSIDVPSLPPAALAQWGPRLQRLQISNRLLASRKQEVRNLTELETLIVDAWRLTPQSLATIAEIPNLRYLAVSPQFHDSNVSSRPAASVVISPPFSPETFQSLSGHPRLRAIFADWSPGTRRVEPAPSGVCLYSVDFSLAQQTSLLLSLFFSAAMAIVVVLQLHAQFITPTSKVVPHYSRPHQSAAVIVLVASVCIAALGLWLTGYAVVPALSLTLAIPAIATFNVVTSHFPSKVIRVLSLVLAFSAAGLIWIPIAIPVSLSPVMAGEALCYFRGDLNAVAIAVLVGEMLLLLFALAELPKLIVRVYEKSSQQPGLTPWDPQQIRRSADVSGRWGQHWFDPVRHRPKFSRSSTWQKVQHWSSGNVFRLRAALTFVVMFIVFWAGLQMLTGGRSKLTNPTVWLVCMMQMGVIALLIPVTIWYRRCSTFETESLRPVGRRSLVRQLFAALALDQSVALIPIVIAGVASLWVQRQGGSPAETRGFLTAAMAALLWCYATSTVVFAVKRSWILVAYAITMIVIPIGWLASMGLFAETSKMPQHQQIMLLYVHSFVACLLSLLVIRITYGLSLRREWG